jgi:N-acetylglucosaminyldiphosphoundecaprenol N-acetyl-beta-D-mannosaminyltransferase
MRLKRSLDYTKLNPIKFREVRQMQGDRVSATGAKARVMVNVGRSTVPVDVISHSDVLTWIFERERQRWEVVVTPNLHHLRIARESPVVAARYAEAALSLADGWPVAMLASRVAGRRVEQVVGADLFESIVQQPVSGRRLVLMGGTAGPHMNDLSDRCRHRGWQVHLEPAPRSELEDVNRRAALVGRVAEIGSGGTVVIGVGMPLQEEIALEVARQPGNGVILCLGNSINFSSGAVSRAPRMFRSLHLEWMYRAMSEPRRLMKRYFGDALVLTPLFRLNRPVQVPASDQTT